MRIKFINKKGKKIMKNRKKYYMVMLPSLVLAILVSYMLPTEQKYWGLSVILIGWVVYYFIKQTNKKRGN